MRRGELLDFVTDLVTERWNGRYDEDIADVVLNDAKFDAFAEVLNHLGGGDKEQVAYAFDLMAAGLSEEHLDWLVGETNDGSQAKNPAAFLADMARKAAV